MDTEHIIDGITCAQDQIFELKKSGCIPTSDHAYDLAGEVRRVAAGAC